MEATLCKIAVVVFFNKIRLCRTFFFIPKKFGQFIKTAHDRKHDTTNKGLKNAGSEILQMAKKEVETMLNE